MRYAASCASDSLRPNQRANQRGRAVISKSLKTDSANPRVCRERARFLAALKTGSGASALFSIPRRRSRRVSRTNSLAAREGSFRPDARQFSAGGASPDRDIANLVGQDDRDNLWDLLAQGRPEALSAAGCFEGHRSFRDSAPGGLYYKSFLRECRAVPMPDRPVRSISAGSRPSLPRTPAAGKARGGCDSNRTKDIAYSQLPYCSPVD